MTVLKVLGIMVLLVALTAGIFVGLSVASMENMGKLREFNETTAALPTQIFDIKGRLITEFYQEEKRTLVKLEDLPPHLIYALITREDQDFFYHHGFSFRGFFRALWNIAAGKYVSGGSTITQQLAGFIYANRANDNSLLRKIKELWYSIQLERNWSKNEILEEYLNKMPFGSGTYGVEAASQYYFGHSAKEMTVAESAVLVIQLASGSGKYSPFRRPNAAREMQQEILGQMVSLGYTTQQEADSSFKKFWTDYDFTRENNPNFSSAFYQRQDRAPYFSMYVLNELENEWLLGDANIYRDGYKVYTTLNLDSQAEAEKLMADGIASANATYKASRSARTQYGEDNFIPVIDLLSLTFDMPQLRVGNIKQQIRSKNEFNETLNPLLDLMSTQFGLGGGVTIRNAIDASYKDARELAQKSTVEGAFISIDDHTGYISAMVGGSKFESSNQFNRATQAKLQPGSSFKPLYYAAGIEKDDITPATLLFDNQVVFMNADGTPYKPLNYKGEWKGSVRVREALAHSMNVPSMKVLARIDWNDAINIPARLLGLSPQDLPERGFKMVMPYALGIVSVSPLEMAKAFATFPNQGREVDPIAIRYIEDRYGKIVVEPEKIIQEAIRKKGPAAQLISPQTAYIMTDLLQSTVNEGTLAFAREKVGGFNMPMAGKTGTPQNWSSAWTVGFSPYETAAVWIGFDRGGNTSLGTSQTGSSIAGPIWAQFMKDTHKDLQPKRFLAPDNGLTWVDVVRDSGLLPPPNFTGKTIKEVFRVGTEPTTFDEFTQWRQDQADSVIKNIGNTMVNSTGTGIDSSSMPDLNLDLELKVNENLIQNGQVPHNDNRSSSSTTVQRSPSAVNSLLD